MDDDERLRLMQDRIIKSFKWQKDVIIPLSKEFNVSVEEIEDLLVSKMDMSSLEAIHATFEVANKECLIKKIHADLRLCWFSGTLEWISKEDADNLKLKVANEILNGKKYDEAIKDARAELFDLIKSD